MPAEYRDIAWDELTQARRALIGNPFSGSSEELAQAEAWFAANAIYVPRAMLGLCSIGRAHDARKLVLAALHAFARSGKLSEHLKFLRQGLELTRTNGVIFDAEDLVRLGSALARFQAASARLIGTSKAMRAIKQQLWTLCFGPHLFDSIEKEPALRRMNVLILGETGTGKELVADLLQAGAFTRELPPSLAINCAALPEDLAEAEFFGFERGAHSTAQHRREGKLVAADGGTLFLDELADLAPEVQVKLLSVIQNGNVTPLGSNTSQKVDVRYVAATSRPIHRLVSEDRFRQDLFERLAGFIIEVPPLRERPEDIVAIGERLFAGARGVSPGSDDSRNNTQAMITGLDGILSREGLDTCWLQSEALEFSWPGNVRELERAIRQRVLGLKSTAATTHVRLQSSKGETLDIPPRILNSQATEAEVLSWYLLRVFEKTNRKVSPTADTLAIDRGTVRRRLEGLGVNVAKKNSE